MDTIPLVFVGGGNMAVAILGGLLAAGRPARSITVIEPLRAQREQLAARHGVRTLAAADASLQGTGIVVWAVKPQIFTEAVRPVAPQVGGALHLSVMAGLRTASLAAATGSERIVRAMPNTPALIGRGMTGLYARPGVTAADRDAVDAVLAATGRCLWVAEEDLLEAVTAISGCGPAYVYYFVEALVRHGVEMGLTESQGLQLALATFEGATALAQQSPDSPTVLRERVSSKGGVTLEALASMEADGVGAAIGRAMRAARRRALELGDEFGAA